RPTRVLPPQPRPARPRRGLDAGRRPGSTDTATVSGTLSTARPGTRGGEAAPSSGASRLPLPQAGEGRGRPGAWFRGGLALPWRLASGTRNDLCQRTVALLRK